MDPIEKNKWVTLHNNGHHYEVRTRINLYIAENSRDLEALHLAKQILDQQYELIKAADVSEQIYALESSVENALNYSESLFRIGSLDRATVILEKHAAELIANPRYYYLKGKIDGWATAKVGARIERIRNSEDDNEWIQKVVYSARDEQGIIIKLLDGLTQKAKPILVDIGASDGVAFSNSRSLIQNFDWGGLLIEPNAEKASLLALNNKSASERTSIIIGFAKSNSIVKILQSFDIPRDFGFLSIDIDSFEYSITDTILERFRPRLVCVEINERIPPPIQFYVHETGVAPPPLLSGMSLSTASLLLKKHNYTSVVLHYNNLFALADEDFFKANMHGQQPKSDKDLYREGFLEKPDAFSSYPWNKEWISLIQLGINDPNTFVQNIREIFQKNHHDVDFAIQIQ
jgi:hypothetical protein